MGERPARVDYAELKTLMRELDLGDSKRNEYILARWNKYIEWWEFRSRGAKWKYFASRATVVVGGALIPALVGLRELWPDSETARWFSVGSIVVSLFVAACAGLESLYGWGSVWREKRMAVEVLTSEGFKFLFLVGEYAGLDREKAYSRFAATLEERIQHEIKDYIVVFQPAPDGKTTGSEPDKP